MLCFRDAIWKVWNPEFFKIGQMSQEPYVIGKEGVYLDNSENGLSSSTAWD